MGKSSSSPPPAPDPTVTAQAQSQANADTARLQATLNRVNQVTPYGSVTYTQGAAPMDRNKWIEDQVAAERAKVDAENKRRAAFEYGGNNYNPETMEQMPGSNPTAVPVVFDEAGFRKSLQSQPTPTVPGQDQWTQTTTLSPEEQRLYDLQTKARTTYGETANTMLDAVRTNLASPVDTDWDSFRTKTIDALKGRMQPNFDQQEEQLRQRLYNSGLTAGSEGFNREMDAFRRSYNDALLGIDLKAGDFVNQGIDAARALRAIPINEAAALLTGSQVTAPQATAPPATNVAPTDVMGAYQTQYQGQLAQWNAQQQQQNAALGGLFGLAGVLGGAGIRKWG